MKTFVTGATGYIGNELIKKLLKNGEELTLLVRNPSSPCIPRHKNITLHIGDILNRKDIIQAMSGCKYVFHCAAIAKMNLKNRNTLFEVNTTGTKNILDAAMHTGVEKIVFTSSAAVFGPSLNIPLTEDDPRIESFESDYDFSKHIAENLVREYAAKGLHAVIVNPSRVYGPGLLTYSNAVNRFIMQIMKRRLMVLPDISQYKANYCFIGDVIDGHIKAMENGRSAGNYILGGENISYDHLLYTIKQYAGGGAKIIKCSARLMKCFLGIINAFYRHPDITPSMVSRFNKHRMLNSNKAMNELGYKITPFEEGMKTTINYLKNL